MSAVERRANRPGRSLPAPVTYPFGDRTTRYREFAAQGSPPPKFNGTNDRDSALILFGDGLSEELFARSGFAR